MRHLTWSQTAYKELLRDHVTFEIARKVPLLVESPRPLAFFRSRPENGAPEFVAELLQHLQHNRYTCPYIILTVVMNPQDAFPKQGGRSLNGGVNAGGGFVQLSSFVLDKAGNLQSLLRHELGHALGLPHVDVYGYDMKSNRSIMAYNSRHETNGFQESRTPGALIPEDLRLLSLNQRVFPKLRFQPQKDVPRGYELRDKIEYLMPMKIPGQPDGIRVTTTSGEMFDSRVGNIVQGRIKPSRDDGSVQFDPATMWHSGNDSNGWVTADLVFPMAVELTAIRVHSQHSGKYNAARAARISIQSGGGQWEVVVEQAVHNIDERVAFGGTQAQTWRLQLAPGSSNRVAVRGLQLYSGDTEIFLPLLVEPQ
jgi:hypothetical protein